jgi:hypothetical protein
MNQLNEQLATIRRQKSLYKKQLDETNDPQEQWDISRKIMVLDEEESKLLNELGVNLDSNNRQ